MRNTILAAAAVLGFGWVGGTAATAAPTTYAEGRTAHVERRPRDGDAPAYRLTGEQRNVVRRIEFREVPRGRGETHSLPFRVTVPRD